MASSESRAARHVFGSSGDIVNELAERATVGAYRTHGPVPARDIEAAARDLRFVAADLLVRGYGVAADVVLRTADRLDETAELARLLQQEVVPV
jgi:hypothetical protein